MNPTLRRLRAPAIAHFAGVPLTAAWFVPLLCVHPPALDEIITAQVGWSVATAPYTLAALLWAWRPRDPAVRSTVRVVVGAGCLLAPTAAACVWLDARGSNVTGGVLLALVLFVVQALGAAGGAIDALSGPVPPAP